VGGGSPIGSSRHCCHQWPTVLAPGDYDDQESGGMIGTGNRSARRKTAPVSLFDHKPHMLSGREPRPPRGKAATNSLSYGTALSLAHTFSVLVALQHR
jgi:hypothetical protein